MGTIYRRGNVWLLDVGAKGRRIRKRVGPSKKIAELAVKDAEVKIARDELGFSRDGLEIETFMDRFLEYSRTNHQPRPTNRYRAVIDHFKTFLQTMPNVTFLSEITSEVIDRYKIYRKDSWVNPNGQPVDEENGVNGHTRKGARAHTINFEVGTLITMLNLAIKWGHLSENPTKRVTKLKVNDAKPPRFLSVEECQRLLEACPSDLYAIYFTFLNTGKRKEELEYLGWTGIDLKRRKIRIRRKEDWQPKTGERDIPINHPLLNLLTELKQKNDKAIMSRYVFGHRDGSRLKTKLREKLIQIAKQAGIADLTRVHTLRHTFASHLVMNGVDLPTVMKLMGHSDIQTTMIYAHLAPDHLANAVTKLPFKRR